jgi:hypothetical protein
MKTNMLTPPRAIRKASLLVMLAASSYGLAVSPAYAQVRTPNEVKSDSLRAQVTSLSDYAGKYKIESATGISTIEIWIKDGKLFGSADGQQTLQLELTGVPDQLLIVENGEKITFVRDDKKQVKSLKINMPDGEVTAVKQPG